MDFCYLVYEGETEDTILRRGRFIKAVEEAGVLDSEDEFERLSTFFASEIQQVAVPPPPLPPRPDELYLGHDLSSVVRPSFYSRLDDLATSNVAPQEQTTEHQMKKEHSIKLREQPVSGDHTRRPDARPPNDSLPHDRNPGSHSPGASHSLLWSPNLSGSASDTHTAASRSIQPQNSQPGPSTRKTKEKRKNLHWVTEESARGFNEERKARDDGDRESKAPSRGRPSTNCKGPELTRPITSYTTNGGISLSKNRRILVVNATDSYPSVIVQYYLELFRVWTANLGGPWIFRQVQSAHLDLDDSTGGLPRFMPSRGRRWCHDPELVKSVLPKYDRTPFGDCLTKEPDHIIDELRRDRIKSLQEIDLRSYDYIICSHQNQIPAVTEAQQTFRTRPEKKIARTLVLSMPFGRKDVLHSKDIMRVVFKSIESFMNTSFGWQRPQRSFMENPFVTAFVRVRLESHRNLSRLNSRFQTIGQESGCSVYRTTHYQSCEANEEILAIVGPQERLAIAQRTVDDYLIGSNMGFVMTKD